MENAAALTAHRQKLPAAPVLVAGPRGALLLGAAPYAAPLARLGKLRSAGINDLRLGNILSSPAGDDGTHRCAQVGLPDVNPHASPGLRTAVFPTCIVNGRWV